MKKALALLLATAAFAGCSSTNPFITNNTDPGQPSVPDGTTTAIPEALSKNMEISSYDPVAQTLTISMTLDTGNAAIPYVRTPGLDVPGYQAYTYQQDGESRHFTALFAQSTDAQGSVRAGVAADGGQFNKYFSGGHYERDAGFVKPVTGVVTYSGTYAGVTNLNGPGAVLLPVTNPAFTPADYPEQSARTAGTVVFSADFDRNVVNGAISNRTLVDYGTILPDVVMVAGDIDTNGIFFGATQYRDQTPSGSYGGIFGGTDAAAVGGIVALDSIDGPTDSLGMQNEGEIGVFVLTR